MGRVSCTFGPRKPGPKNKELQCPGASPAVCLPKTSLSFWILCLKWFKCPQEEAGLCSEDVTLTLLVMHSSATRVCSSWCCRVSAWLCTASCARRCLWSWYRLVRTSSCSCPTVSCSLLISWFCSASLDSCSATT